METSNVRSGTLSTLPIDYKPNKLLLFDRDLVVYCNKQVFIYDVTSLSLKTAIDFDEDVVDVAKLENRYVIACSNRTIYDQDRKVICNTKKDIEHIVGCGDTLLVATVADVSWLNNGKLDLIVKDFANDLVSMGVSCFVLQTFSKIKVFEYSYETWKQSGELSCSHHDSPKIVCTSKYIGLTTRSYDKDIRLRVYHRDLSRKLMDKWTNTSPHELVMNDYFMFMLRDDRLFTYSFPFTKKALVELEDECSLAQCNNDLVVFYKSGYLCAYNPSKLVKIDVFQFITDIDENNLSWIDEYDRNINSTRINDKYDTPLIYACRKGANELILKMMERLDLERSINFENSDYHDALYEAIVNGCSEDVIRGLFKNGAHFQRMDDMDSAYVKLLEKGDTSLTRWVFTNIPKRDEYIIYFMKKGVVSIVKFLIQHGYDAKCTNYRGDTLPMIGVKHHELFEFFKNAGADFNALNNNKQSIITIASQQKCVESMKILVESYITDKNILQDAMNEFIEIGETSMVKDLVDKHDLDVNKKSSVYRTLPFELACSTTNHELLAYFLSDDDFDPETSNEKGQNCLEILVQHCSNEFVDIFEGIIDLMSAPIGFEKKHQSKLANFPNYRKVLLDVNEHTTTQNTLVPPHNGGLIMIRSNSLERYDKRNDAFEPVGLGTKICDYDENKVKDILVYGKYTAVVHKPVNKETFREISQQFPSQVRSEMVAFTDDGEDIIIAPESISGNEPFKLYLDTERRHPNFVEKMRMGEFIDPKFLGRAPTTNVFHYINRGEAMVYHYDGRGMLDGFCIFTSVESTKSFFVDLLVTEPKSANGVGMILLKYVHHLATICGADYVSLEPVDSAVEFYRRNFGYYEDYACMKKDLGIQYVDIYKKSKHIRRDSFNDCIELKLLPDNIIIPQIRISKQRPIGCYNSHGEYVSLSGRTLFVNSSSFVDFKAIQITQGSTPDMFWVLGQFVKNRHDMLSIWLYNHKTKVFSRKFDWEEKNPINSECMFSCDKGLFSIYSNGFLHIANNDDLFSYELLRTVKKVQIVSSNQVVVYYTYNDVQIFTIPVEEDKTEQPPTKKMKTTTKVVQYRNRLIDTKTLMKKQKNKIERIRQHALKNNTDPKTTILHNMHPHAHRAWPSTQAFMEYINIAVK